MLECFNESTINNRPDVLTRYDKRSTFPLNCFLNDEGPQPKLVGMPIFFRKMAFSYTGAMGLFIGMQFNFCSKSLFE